MKIKNTKNAETIIGDLMAKIRTLVFLQIMFVVVFTACLLSFLVDKKFYPINSFPIISEIAMMVIFSAACLIAWVKNRKNIKHRQQILDHMNPWNDPWKN